MAADRWHVDERGERLFSALGIENIDDVERFRGGSVIVSGRHRVVRRIDADGHAAYLKQIFRVGRLDAARRFMAGGDRESVAALEAKHHELLRRQGIACPDVLAWGDRSGVMGERFSFLLTTEAPGADLEVLLSRGELDSTRRAAVGRSLRDLIGRLAAARLEFVDLVPKHLFVREHAGEASITVIDAHRLEPVRNESESLERALARLDAELPLFAVSAAERLRFAKSLDPLLDREALRRIVKRAERLRRRRATRRNLLTRPRPSDLCSVVDPSGCFLHDPTASKRLRAIGLDLLRPDAFDPAACVADDVRVEWGDAAAIRDLFNAHHLLRGFVRVPRLLARHQPSGGACAYLIVDSSSGAKPLAEVTPNARSIASVSAAVSALALMGIDGRGGPSEWIRLDGDEAVVCPRLGVDFSARPRERIGARLVRGLPLPWRHLVVASWPRLLGCRRLV